MTRFASAAALALAITLPAVSAQAQAPRTFVSAAGSDSNPCTFAAPCRHFQSAVNATSLGGEVDALDPAGYGPIVISQAITIEGQGWSYIAPPASGNGITINAGPGDSVIIHGVSLNGVGATGSTNGIAFNSGASLSIEDCAIRHFLNKGILLEPHSSSTFSILNSVVSHNGGGDGIFVFPTGFTGSVRGSLERVFIGDNGGDGLAALGSSFSGTLDVFIRDSSVVNNGLIGIVSTGTIGASTTVTVQNTTSAGNNIGLDATGAAGTLRVTKSTITRNNIGLQTPQGGTIESFGDNVMRDNATEGAPTTTVSLK